MKNNKKKLILNSETLKTLTQSIAEEVKGGAYRTVTSAAGPPSTIC